MANRKSSKEKTADVSRIQMEYLGVCDGPLGIEGEETDISKKNEEEEEELTGFDLSRLTPRVYQTLLPARNAIRTEVFGLLCAQKGQSALEIVDSRDAKYRRVGKIRMTLLVKLKAGRKYKARLCIRGDLESLIKSSTFHKRDAETLHEYSGEWKWVPMRINGHIASVCASR